MGFQEKHGGIWNRVQTLLTLIKVKIIKVQMLMKVLYLKKKKG